MEEVMVHCERCLDDKEELTQAAEGKGDQRTK